MTTISCCGYTKVRDWGFLQEKRSLEAEFDEKDLTKAPEQVQELDLKIDWSNPVCEVQPFNGDFGGQDIPRHSHV